MIRVYSKKHRGSFDIVEMGLVRALEAAGVFAGAVDLDKDEHFPGVTAKRAIVVGNPYLAQLAHLRGIHEEVWLLLAPNSVGIPPAIEELLTQDIYSVSKGGMSALVQGLFSPSKWGVKVLERSFPNIKTRLLRHGVLAEFECSLAQRDAVRASFDDEGKFVVLHSSSTYTDRKGTEELIEAWTGFEKRVPQAELFIACQPGLWTRFQQVANKHRAKNVRMYKFFGTLLKDWARVLGGAHAVAQPSRGEGFGLVPLEARAAGVPVLTTDCTGHSEHVTNVPGVVVIPTGRLADVQDYPGAQAPSVTPVDIETGLHSLYDNYLIHHDAAVSQAPCILRDWAWEKVIAEDLEAIGWTK